MDVTIAVTIRTSAVKETSNGALNRSDGLNVGRYSMLWRCMNFSSIGLDVRIAQMKKQKPE